MALAMTLERFRELVQAHGGELRRWPEAEVAGARALLAASTAARALCEEALALDQLLDRMPVPVPSAALIGRILDAAPEPAAANWRQLLFGPTPVWRLAATLVLAAGLGLGLGWSGVGRPSGPEAAIVDVTAFAFEITGEEAWN